jgi:hypothetical protein
MICQNGLQTCQQHFCTVEEIALSRKPDLLLKAEQHLLLRDVFQHMLPVL